MDPTIGKEFFAKSIVAVVAASLLILVYIAVRFKKIGGWPAGSMAVVALVHDLIVVYGVFVVMRIPLNGNFIAALLTILGYSINDTVVIYDRVRENRQLYGNSMDFATLVNNSINQSLRRSINTTISTLLALGTVCVVSVVFGLDSIFTFAFPLIIGMISGVYSTICIAGPLWVEWELHKKAKPRKKKAGIGNTKRTYLGCVRFLLAKRPGLCHNKSNQARCFDHAVRNIHFLLLPAGNSRGAVRTARRRRGNGGDFSQHIQ